tara:strand:- start:118 stop:501 length:384 start_codon:yes stop_codon:yes gene_type:complete
MIKKKNSNRSFGLLFFIVFLIIGLWPLLNSNNVNIVFLIFSIPFLILGILNSSFLTPLNNAWIKLGELLGKIIAPIIMFLIYFIFLTPISIFVRIFGKDLLGLKISKKSESYWLKRKKDLGSMNRQF